MRALVSTTRWLWNFIAGEDPLTALGVVAALALTALIADTGAAAWWVMPPAIVVLLALSLHRASR
jgi:hypothetical protein